MSMEFNSARSYVRIEDNLEEGESWALLALDIEPDNAQIPYFLATEIYRPQKNGKKMVEMYREALRRNSNLDLENPFKSGDEIIRTIHEAIKNEAREIYNKGTKYYSKGKKKKAEQQFKLSINLNPNLIENFIALSYRWCNIFRHNLYSGLYLAIFQYFFAIGKNSLELSTAIIFPFAGKPLAIQRVLNPVKRPISKQLMDCEILTIISKN